MEIPGHIRQRMPQDLLRYIQNQQTVANIPVCEREPDNVPHGVISAGPFEMRVYFLFSTSGRTAVFIHFPGG